MLSSQPINSTSQHHHQELLNRSGHSNELSFNTAAADQSMNDSDSMALNASNEASNATAEAPMEVECEKAKRKLDAGGHGGDGGRKKKDWTNVKKAKLCKHQPVYKPDVSPSQALHDLHPGLVYLYDEERQPSRVRYICNVTIELGEGAEKRLFKFSGDGLSKKEAKKNCCLVALVTLYGDTYKPPKQEPVVEEELDSAASQQARQDWQKRLAKIINPSTIKFKSASQMLNELDVQVSETVRELEKQPGHEDQFAFQYTNVNADPSDPGRFAVGFGRCKKDAKNQAAKQALKQFFSCDLDQVGKGESTNL